MKELKDFEKYLKHCSTLDIDFKDVINTERLTLEKTDVNNYKLIYQMFYKDESHFIDKRFKDLKELDAYFNETLKYLTHTARGCDWIIFLSGKEIP